MTFANSFVKIVHQSSIEKGTDEEYHDVKQKTNPFLQLVLDEETKSMSVLCG